MSAPLFSIIVPVYNAGEQFLNRCFDSIASQTFRDYEVLIVDDGSKDDSGKFCDRYAETHEKFRVFHKENGGVASARNYAIDRAEGDWITFVDNDDWLDPNTLERLNQHLQDNVDMIVFDTKALFPDGTQASYKTLPFQNNTCLNDAERKAFLLDLVAEGYAKQSAAHGIMAVWDKMFRRTALNEHRIRGHEDLRIADDLLFTIDCVRKLGGQILYLEEPMYCRFMNPESDSNSYHPEIIENDRKFLHYLHQSLEGVRDDNEIKLALQKRYTICLLGLCAYDMCHRNNPKPQKQKLAELKQMARTEPYQTAMKECNLKWLRKKRQLQVILLRMHLYRAFLAASERLY